MIMPGLWERMKRNIEPDAARIPHGPFTASMYAYLRGLVSVSEVIATYNLTDTGSPSEQDDTAGIITFMTGGRLDHKNDMEAGGVVAKGAGKAVRRSLWCTSRRSCRRASINRT